MCKEDLYLLKTLKGAAVYHGHSAAEQAKIAKMSRATWYRKLQEPESFTLAELRRLVSHYKIGIDEICDFLGVRRSQ